MSNLRIEKPTLANVPNAMAERMKYSLLSIYFPDEDAFPPWLPERALFGEAFLFPPLSVSLMATFPLPRFW